MTKAGFILKAVYNTDPMTFSRLQALFQSFTPLQRSILSGLCGLIFYGGWAIFVNWKHGLGAAIKAGCVQGSYSFILTLSMTMLIEGMFKINSKVFKKALLVNWSTIIICCAAIFSLSWGINFAAGTPEILRTVILGYVVGGIYSITYVYGLARSENF